MTCPQCDHATFVTISPTLSRCASCRWLIRTATGKTAFDPYKPKRRKPKRTVSRGDAMDVWGT